MFSFFGLCTPSSAFTQVVPRRYLSSDGDSSGNDSPKRNVDLIRLKPQPSWSANSAVVPVNATPSISSELSIFLQDLTFNPSEIRILNADTRITYYNLNKTTLKSSCILVNLLIETILKAKGEYIHANIPSKTGKSNKNLFSQQEFESTPNCLLACSLYIQILNNKKDYLFHDEQEEEDNVFIDDNLDNLEYIFFVTVSIMN